MAREQKLTSHELGFYRDFAEAPMRQPAQKRKEPTTPYDYQKDYFYLFLRRVAVRGIVSLTQKEIAEKLSITVQTVRRGQQRLEKLGILVREKDCDPIGRLPTVYKLKNLEKKPLSEEEQKLRTPPLVESLIEAKNETIHENVSKVKRR